MACQSSFLIPLPPIHVPYTIALAVVRRTRALSSASLTTIVTAMSARMNLFSTTWQIIDGPQQEGAWDLET